MKEGQDLVTLEDIAPLKVDFRLPEVMLTDLKRGQTVEVASDAMPDRTYAATLYAIDPLVDQNGRAVVLRARLKNTEGQLRPGMFVADAPHPRASARTPLIVPEEALMPTGNDQYVYKVVDGKATRAKVKTGLRRNSQVEVVEGLQAGDVVVTAGQIKLRDGVAGSHRSAARAHRPRPGRRRRRSRARTLILSDISIRRPVLATVMSLIDRADRHRRYPAPAGARVPEDRRAGGHGRDEVPRARAPRSSRRRSPSRSRTRSPASRASTCITSISRAGEQPDHRPLPARARPRRRRERRARPRRARRAASCRTRSTSRSSPRSRPTPSRSSGSPSRATATRRWRSPTIADRFVKDRLQTLPGVADVRIFGERRYADAHLARPRPAWRPTG